MHVHTQTPITPDEVRARFETAAKTSAIIDHPSRKLLYSTERRPPKFFLTGTPATLPAAAEVAIMEASHGTDVILRLMWGPLPAPFPRAMAATGIAIGLLLAWFAGNSPVLWLLAALIAVLPVAALLYQKRGEQYLQSRLGELLGGAKFSPRPH